MFRVFPALLFPQGVFAFKLIRFQQNVLINYEVVK